MNARPTRPLLRATATQTLASIPAAQFLPPLVGNLAYAFVELTGTGALTCTLGLAVRSRLERDSPKNFEGMDETDLVLSGNTTVRKVILLRDVPLGAEWTLFVKGISGTGATVEVSVNTGAVPGRGF